MSPRKRYQRDENTPLGPPSTPAPSRSRAGNFFNSFSTPLSSSPLFTPSLNKAGSFEFVDAFTPVPKRRKVGLGAKNISNTLGNEGRGFVLAEVQRSREEQLRVAEEAEKQRLEEEEANKHKAEDARLNEVLQCIQRVGYPTLHTFIHSLLTTKDQYRSSQVSRMLIKHGNSILDDIRRRQPQVAHDWALSTVRELVAAEGERLAKRFRPEQKQPISETLKSFSVAGFLSEAESLAPSTCRVLRNIGFPETSSAERIKKQDLILAVTLCMLARSRNEHATEFQTSMAMYFLACGTSKALFDVLNHAGLSLSYTQTISKLKQLSEERLEETRRVAKTKAFMLVWDNLNIAFKVSEQRHDSKDHFDNGTTATLVPLFGVERGQLPLKPQRTHRRNILKYGPEDLVPSREEAERVQVGQLWHIKDILYDAFPALRERLGSSILPPPTVKQVPIHKTEQYPLPAMHIDESVVWLFRVRRDQESHIAFGFIRMFHDSNR